jgi:hypothetical protein
VEIGWPDRTVRKEAAWQQSDDLIERSENIHMASIGWPDHTVRMEPRGTAQNGLQDTTWW